MMEVDGVEEVLGSEADKVKNEKLVYHSGTWCL